MSCCLSQMLFVSVAQRCLSFTPECIASRKLTSTLVSPYLLCAQVIAVIFLIQLRLNEKWVGGGIDPWPHLSVPLLFLRQECTGMSLSSHHWADHKQTNTAHTEVIDQYECREEIQIIGIKRFMRKLEHEGGNINQNFTDVLHYNDSCSVFHETIAEGSSSKGSV